MGDSGRTAVVTFFLCRSINHCLPELPAIIISVETCGFVSQMFSCFGCLPPCTTALTHVVGGKSFKLVGGGFRSGKWRSCDFHVSERRMFSVLAEHTLSLEVSDPQR